jgi:hypothetical protein
MASLASSSINHVEFSSDVQTTVMTITKRCCDGVIKLCEDKIRFISFSASSSVHVLAFRKSMYALWHLPM